jgi:hypothetical protein
MGWETFTLQSMILQYRRFVVCNSVKSELISDPLLELSNTRPSSLAPIPGIPDPLCLDRRATRRTEVRWRSAP